MATIAKLNKNIKNKGEEGYEESPINKKLLQDICDKADEIIENLDCKIISQANTDLDDFTETGIFFFDANQKPLNIPAGSNGWLQVIKGSGYFVKQIWYRAGTANSNDFEIYVRTNTGSWSKWVSVFENPGLYRLTGILSLSTVGTEITLSDSVVNYDYLLIATGSISGNDYITHQIVPFISNFPLNQRGRGKWGAWEGMTAVCHTLTGKVVFTFESETKMKIKSFSGNEPLRGIFGVKLY